jgi:hypothetical protein
MNTTLVKTNVIECTMDDDVGSDDNIIANALSACKSDVNDAIRSITRMGKKNLNLIVRNYRIRDRTKHP